MRSPSWRAGPSPRNGGSGPSPAAVGPARGVEVRGGPQGDGVLSPETVSPSTNTRRPPPARSPRSRSRPASAHPPGSGPGRRPGAASRGHQYHQDGQFGHRRDEATWRGFAAALQRLGASTQVVPAALRRLPNQLWGRKGRRLRRSFSCPAFLLPPACGGRASNPPGHQPQGVGSSPAWTGAGGSLRTSWDGAPT